MAQPVFEDHPLEQYLKGTGERTELMPGASAEFVPEDLEEEEADEAYYLPVFLQRLLEDVRELVDSTRGASSQHQFAERFKYDVISSSLLSTSVSSPLPPRRAASPDLPGRFRRASLTPSDVSEKAAAPADYERLTMTIGAFACFAAAMHRYALAALALGVAAYFYLQPDGRQPNSSVTLEALNELIRAGEVWDSAVNEAMSTVDREDSALAYGASPSSPTSPLRVTLNSSLHTTSTQCEKVRALLSALTAPAELSQMSEMYAPPSPMLTSFSVHAPRVRAESMPSDAEKRQTWNGSYSSLATAGSRMRRREKHRSDLSSLMGSTMSAPTSPAPHTPLPEVEEEGEELEKGYFGSAALGLQRRRKYNGLGSPSRFTTMQARHPLTLNSLHQAVQTAISSKRYACSHLLALRFEEEELGDDYSYWEDVRSVMALLTSTLMDASARLLEGLDDHEKRRTDDGTPTPAVTPEEGLSTHSRIVSLDLDATQSRRNSRRKSRTVQQMMGFAPMPSHMTRLAAHVDTMSSALNEAREHLEQCMAALRDPPETSEASTEPLPPQEAPALKAYDRLRRELGFALRECERGRERLLDVLAVHNSQDTDPFADPDDADDVPLLARDESDESDKHHSLRTQFRDSIGSGESVLEVAIAEPEHEYDAAMLDRLPPIGAEQVYEADTSGIVPFVRERAKLSRDERIRLAKARREQGLEPTTLADADAEADTPRGYSERWGPGGDVVQELKDVIWQVGERRRQMIQDLEAEAGGPSPTDEGEMTHTDALLTNS